MLYRCHTCSSTLRPEGIGKFMCRNAECNQFKRLVRR